MTEKLDPYAPTKERLRAIKRLLLRAGIPDELIPEDWVSATIAAMEKWILTTDEGMGYIGSLLGFSIRYGDSDKEYTLIDNVNGNHKSLKNTQVLFFEGIVADGHPVPQVNLENKNFIPPLELDISESAKDKCDCCGIVSHCLKEILNPASDKLECLCNYCISYSEHPRVNAYGGFDVCQECTVRSCCHHPYREGNSERSGGAIRA